ncbi:MAG: GNAT family N-acetyltransferase [Pseudonocardiaceae bacterium]
MGPVLVRVEDRQVVGAIGPMGTLLDAAGMRMLLPQYFAVHPRYRRRGHGRALWRAAMARRTGPSTRFCKPARGVQQNGSILLRVC